MDSDLADAKEIKAAEESAWEILTGFSLPKYAVDSLTHYKNNPESFKNEVLSGITVAVMQVPESVAFSFVAGVPPLVAVWKSKFTASSTRHLLDSVVVLVPHRSTEPGRPRHPREMT
jgi:hypothetical protein